MRCSALFTLLLLSFFSFGQTYTLYVGTYTGTGSKGIYIYRFNSITGALLAAGATDSGTINNPSFVALAPSGQYLYAVTETGGKKDPGSVAAFKVETGGKIRFINKMPSGGDHPCHVAVHPHGRWVTSGNYSGGSLAALPVNTDGSLQAPAQIIQHQGTGVNTARQEKAHVHMTLFSPDGRQLFVPDLGTDQLHLYNFQAGTKQPITPAEQPFVKSEPGNGPRHLTFHPNGRFAYLMEELSGTVSAYAYQNGKLQFLQRISSHAAGYTGNKGSADIHVSPDGKFLYASNRGDANTIAAFSIAASGMLTWVGETSSGGRVPRNFAIAPGGRYLLVANQESGNVVVFRRDAVTGKLTQTGTEAAIPKPVCLVFASESR